MDETFCAPVRREWGSNHNPYWKAAFHYCTTDLSDIYGDPECP